MIKAGDKVSDRKILGELYTDDRNDRHTQFTGFFVVKSGNGIQLVRFAEVSDMAVAVSATMPKQSVINAGSLDMGYRQYRRFAPRA